MDSTTAKAPCYYVHYESVGLSQEDANNDLSYLDELQLADVTHHIKAMDSIKLKRGDLVCISQLEQFHADVSESLIRQMPYSTDLRQENEGVYIYDGQILEGLSCQHNKHGHIPASYTFPEFPLNYFWNEIHGESNLTWFDNSVREVMLQSVNNDQLHYTSVWQYDKFLECLELAFEYDNVNYMLRRNWQVPDRMMRNALSSSFKENISEKLQGRRNRPASIHDKNVFFELSHISMENAVTVLHFE